MNPAKTNIDPIQFPEFRTKEQIRMAIDELDNRKLTYDERASLEMLIERKAAIFYAQGREIKQAVDLQKTKIIKNALLMGLTFEQCADIADVPVNFVLSVRQQLSVD